MKYAVSLGICFSLCLAASAQDVPVETLVEQLASDDLEQRRDAAYALADIGAEAVPAVQALAKALHDPDIQVWSASTKALAQLGPQAAPAIDDLLERMDSSDEQRLYRSAHAVGQIGVKAIEKLTPLLAEGSKQSRLGAIHALGWIGPEAGPAVPDLVRFLSENDDQLRDAAIKNLAKIGAASIPALLESLERSDVAARVSAARALARIGPAAQTAADQLAVASGHDDAALRAAAISALGSVAGDLTVIIDPLLRGLGDESEVVRRESVEACLRAAPELQRKMAGRLTAMLGDSDPDLSTRVAFVLGGFGEHASSAVHALMDRLVSTDQVAELSNALGRIGEPAIEPALDALRSGRLSARKASEVVAAMPAPVKSRLAKRLTDDNPRVREVAARTIATLVPLPREAVESLGGMMRDADAGVREAAANSLASMGKRAKAVAAQVAAQVTDERSADVRSALIRALGSIESDTTVLMEILPQTVSDPQGKVRLEALRQLNRLSELPESMHADLVAMLQEDDDPRVRAESALALVLVQPRRLESIDSMIGALDDADFEVRKSVLRALPELDAGSPRIVQAISGQLEVEQLRIAAIESLAAMQAGEAFDLVAALSGDADAGVRLSVVKSLRKVGDSAERILPLLIGALEDEEWAIRNVAALELGEMGEAASPAIPALLHLLQQDDDVDAVRQAIREINTAGDEAVPMLLEIIQDESAAQRARYYAIYLLRKMGARARAALPTLRDRLENADGRWREYLERAIREIEFPDED